MGMSGLIPYTWLSEQVASRACVSEISGHSGCCSPGLCEKKRSQERWDEHLSRTPGLPSKLRVGDVSRKSAGIPGVAVLVCASKRGARSDGMCTYPVHLA